METATVVLPALLFIFFVILISIRIIQQGERGVVLRFGKFRRVLEPGFNVVIPLIDRVLKVDVRQNPRPLSRQKTLTADKIEVTVDAVVTYVVADPIAAIVNVVNFHDAVSLHAETTLRAVIGRYDFSNLLAHRDEVNNELLQELQTMASQYGLQIISLAIRDFTVPEQMARAVAAVVEAKQAAEARMASANGELNAAKILQEAAQSMSDRAMQLRGLSTLQTIATENAVIVVPADMTAMAAGSLSAAVMQASEAKAESKARLAEARSD